jgi:hypothetical protein
LYVFELCQRVGGDAEMKRIITGKLDCGGRARKARRALLAAVVPVLLWAIALPTALNAQASGTTYIVNQTIGNGSVVGQITTDGKVGVLSSSDILSWNLNLNGVGASAVLTSAGGTSAVLYSGSDLTGTNQGLFFNFSGTDGGYLGIQDSQQIYSGNRYICENTTWSGCKPGASVVPGSYTDASAQFATESGTQELGTAGPTGPNITDQQIINSLEALAQARAAQALINQLEAQILLGLNEQISCGNCGGGSISFGSTDASAHGRYAFSPEWTLLTGADLGQYSQQEAQVNFTTGTAAAIQYDPTKFGASRPYAEAGITATYQKITYDRGYVSSTGAGSGAGKTHGYDLSAYAEAGWVDRISPRTEAGAYLSYSRMWQNVAGYTETASSDNPLGAVIPAGTDVMDVAAFNAQATHLIGRRVEADFNGAVEWAFNTHSGLKATVASTEVAASQPSFVYYQAGSRVSIRLKSKLTADLFINSVLATHGVGCSAHGGLGFRWAF